MTTFPPTPFRRKGVTAVQPLRGFLAFGFGSPWIRPAEG
ncbi:MAG: hypothetical protein MOGDAGHF_02787 [Rhodocyclaceae bacterium]|jgi:hypothetical protein|nr:hypothetical protein [Rhodocyclaceae bacterium]